MASADSSAKGDFAPGQDVVFGGLVGRADLNGKAGNLQSWNSDTGRWVVTVRGGTESVNVRAVNLQSAPAKAAVAPAAPPARRREPARKSPAPASPELAVGQRVKLVGLVSRPDLNGAIGELTSWDADGSRWCLVLKDKRRLNLRPANLQAVQTATAKAKRGKPKFLGRGKPKQSSSQENGDTTKSTPRVRKAAAGGAGSGAGRVKAPKKPKKATSGYMLFCKKYRQEVIDEMRKDYGNVSLPEIARDLAFRWRWLDEKEKSKFQRQADKRKETQQAKMQAYKEAIDPIGSLKRKYEHLIPKRPTTAFFLFSSDENQRRKAAAALQWQQSQQAEGAEEAGVASVLSEMWKTLSAEDKAPYDLQWKKDKAEFDVKMKVWQQSKEFAEIDKLERKQKEKEQAEKQAKQDAEDAELQSLLKKKATAGWGLEAGRSALIVGLTSRQDLIGTEVSLLSYDEENERWLVSVTDSEEGTQLNLRPGNLIWSRLFRELEKAEEEAEKEARKEAKKAEETEIQELFKKDGAVPGVGLAAGRCAVVSGAEEDLNGKEVQLIEFDDETDTWEASVVGDSDAAQISLPPSHLILSGLLKEAQKNEKKQTAMATKQQKEEEKKAAKRAKKETEEAEFKELIKRGAGAGEGLAAGRSAVITGTSKEELNGSEVQILEFVEDTGRWRVSRLGAIHSGTAPMNLKPENLILSRLHKEIEKNAIKAAKEEQKEAQRAMRAAIKEAERAFKESALKLTSGGI